MNYSEPLPVQFYDFLFFFGFGFLDGLLFKAVEFFRKLFGNGKRAFLFQDLVFSVLSTVLMFIFLLIYADGVVRVNLIAASILGTSAFFLTVGKPVGKVLDVLSLAIRKVVSVLTAPAFFFSKKFLSLFKKASGFTKEKRKAFEEKKKEGGKEKKKKEKKIRKKPEKKRKNS
ncbi:MAG: spore cortex biosynthesis protein YabQ [Clostridia bacterium]|nr:spore cortex biosynthesis protein YabQ [Clostridia bacterium]